MQYLRDYVNPKNIQTSIEIKLQIIGNSFYKLGFKYKDMKKDMFVDKNEQPDVVEDC